MQRLWGRRGHRGVSGAGLGRHALDGVQTGCALRASARLPSAVSATSMLSLARLSQAFLPCLQCRSDGLQTPLSPSAGTPSCCARARAAAWRCTFSATA